MLERKNYTALAPAAGPYSHSVIHNNVLYTSGLSAFGGKAEGENIGAQARDIFAQLKVICKAHDTTLANLIKVTLFVSDMSEILLLREELFDIYGTDLPASSLIKVSGLFSDQINIEIEAIIAL